MTDDEIGRALAKAQKAAVAAIGGSKQAGAMLFPDKEIDDADGLVCDCINPNHRAKFSLVQFVKLLAAAREANCHDAMHALERAAGYSTSRPFTSNAAAAGSPLAAVKGGEMLIPTLLMEMLTAMRDSHGMLVEISGRAEGMDDKLGKLTSGL